MKTSMLFQNMTQLKNCTRNTPDTVYCRKGKAKSVCALKKDTEINPVLKFVDDVKINTAHKT